MTERKWHLEHADGSEWTREELTALIRRYVGDVELPTSFEWWHTYIDQSDHVVLMDTWGGWHAVMMDAEDMAVIRDDLETGAEL